MIQKFRLATSKAIDQLATIFNLPNETNMQDWSYEVANPYDIEKYIAYYKTISNEDEKFVLGQMIIQATLDQFSEDRVIELWSKIKPIFIEDFAIHKDTIYYWAELTEAEFEHCSIISPLLRQLSADNKRSL